MEKDGKEKTGRRIGIVRHTIKTQLDPEIPDPLPYEFPNISAWLENICLDSPPKSPVEKYQIGLTFGENYVSNTRSATLSLFGWDAEDEDDSTSVEWISFEPSKPHMRLPDDYWVGLDKEVLHEKIIAEIEKFITSSTFQSSFLTKSKSIVYRTNGRRLWQSTESVAD